MSVRHPEECANTRQIDMWWRCELSKDAMTTAAILIYDMCFANHAMTTKSRPEPNAYTVRGGLANLDLQRRIELRLCAKC